LLIDPVFPASLWRSTFRKGVSAWSIRGSGSPASSLSSLDCWKATSLALFSVSTSLGGSVVFSFLAHLLVEASRVVGVGRARAGPLSDSLLGTHFFPTFQARVAPPSILKSWIWTRQALFKSPHFLPPLEGSCGWLTEAQGRLFTITIAVSFVSLWTPS